MIEILCLLVTLPRWKSLQENKRWRVSVTEWETVGDRGDRRGNCAWRFVVARRLLMSPRLLACTIALTVGAIVAAAQTGAPGTPAVPLTTVASEAQEHFLRGVAWLHSFEYEDAIAAFRRAQDVERGWAMAYWGEALSYSQPLWGSEDVAAARTALNRLAPTAAARRSRTPDAKGQALMAAVETLFGEGTRPVRARAYADAMERLAVQYPADDEIASFTALAWLGTSPHAAMAGSDDRHPSDLAGTDVQRRAAAMLQTVLARNPRHPGANHYLIHAYDDPAHAALALPAARAYAAIAPASSHARHMPAHVFLRLGLWEEAAASDRAAFAASDARVRQRGRPLEQRDYHSLSWLHYAYLQLGRYRDAGALLSTVREGGGSEPTRVRTYFGSMLARQAIETRRWTEFHARNDYIGPDDLFAVGLSAAMGNDLARARLARERLYAVSTSDRVRDLKVFASIMEQQLSAVIAAKTGDYAGALRLARAAAAIEDRLPPSVGRPHPPKPSHELIGEILLDAGRPGEAMVEFRLSLERLPGRALSRLGLARASSRAGQRDVARTQARALLETWHGADGDLAERDELTRIAR